MVNVRHALLAAGGVLVLGVVVYLFIEVRTSSAQAPAGPVTPAVPKVASAPPRVEPETAPPPTPPVTQPLVPKVAPVTPPSPPLTQTPPPSLGNDVAVGKMAPPEDATKANPKIDAVMAEANKAYDRSDFDEAKQIAQKVLATDPKNVRMLRVMVSASCIDGDTAVAQRHYLLLPEADRAQMRMRCERYGVGFKEQP